MTHATASLATTTETPNMHAIHANLIAEAARVRETLDALAAEANRNLLADSEAGYRLRMAANNVALALASLPGEVATMEA